MKLVKKVKALYANESMTIQSKAPNLLYLLLIIIIAVPLTLISDLLQGNLPSVVIQALIFAASITSLFSLLRGRFQSASIILLIVYSLALTGLSFFAEPQNVHQTYMIVVFMLTPVVLSILISNKPKLTWILAAYGFLIITFVSFFQIYPKIHMELAAFFIPFFIAVVIYALLCFFLIRISLSSFWTTSNLEATSTKNLNVLRKVVELIGESQNTNIAIQTLENDFQKADSSIRAIFLQVNELNKGSDQLQGSVEAVNDALEKTAEQARGFDNQIEEQNTAVLESTAAVNEMSASLDSVANITMEKKESADKLLIVAEQGLTALAETNKSLEHVNSKMNDLLKINKIVSTIAAQTNLLSMNAAIEAAHAGSHGQGFAVVANEIRNLAGSSAQNSRTIADDVKQLLTFLGETTTHADKTDKAMKEIMNEIQEVSNALNEITHSTAELSNGGREILNAMQILQSTSMTVKDGFEQIAAEQEAANTEMRSVKEVSSQVSTATDTVDTALKDIDTTLQHLHAVIKNTVEKSNTLQESMSSLTDSL